MLHQVFIEYAGWFARYWFEEHQHSFMERAHALERVTIQLDAERLHFSKSLSVPLRHLPPAVLNAIGEAISYEQFKTVVRRKNNTIHFSQYKDVRYLNQCHRFLSFVLLHALQLDPIHVYAYVIRHEMSYMHGLLSESIYIHIDESKIE